MTNNVFLRKTPFLVYKKVGFNVVKFTRVCNRTRWGLMNMMCLN